MGTNVCYGNTNNVFANITFTRQCDLVGMRLRHVSGGFKQNRYTFGPYWFWTVVTNASDSVVFPAKPLSGMYTNLHPIIFHHIDFHFR